MKNSVTLAIFIFFYVIVPLLINYISHIGFWYSLGFTLITYFLLGNIYDFALDYWRGRRL
jgi:hypothetical protein